MISAATVFDSLARGARLHCGSPGENLYFLFVTMICDEQKMYKKAAGLDAVSILLSRRTLRRCARLGCWRSVALVFGPVGIASSIPSAHVSRFAES